MIRWLKSVLLGGVAVASALIVGWFAGRRRKELDDRIEELEAYEQTRVRMDEVGRLADADAARQWLHDRDK